jgi:hypothetical protein
MVTPLASWSFDEASGNVLDYSGNNRHWTLNNSAIRSASGHTGNGMTKNNVGFPVAASPAFGQTNQRTFMFWLQGAGNGTWIFRFYIISDDTGSWGLYNLGGTLNLRMRKGGSNTNTQFAFPGDGAYHHYAGTYDGSNARLYVDGNLVATSSTVTAPLDNADRIELLESSVTSQIMDDIRIFDVALTQSEIQTWMNTPVTDADAGTTNTYYYNGTIWTPSARRIWNGSSWLDA